MAKPPKPPDGFDAQKVIRALTDFGQKLGVDALIFSLIIVGVFAALIYGIHAALAVTFGIVILLLWLANKALNAYLEEARAKTRLMELKATEGRSLLIKHRRKRHLPLPAPRPVEVKNLDES